MCRFSLLDYNPLVIFGFQLLSGLSALTRARERARTLISPSGFTLSTKKIPKKVSAAVIF